MSSRKERTKYVCSSCGEQSLRWFGRCPGCDGWNTLVEQAPQQSMRLGGRRIRGIGVEGDAVSSHPLNGAQAKKHARYPLGESEIDRVLGGGIVPGSLLLLGGEPGVGKSTLLLQLAGEFSSRHGSVLYISGEESEQQVALRAARLGIHSDKINILCETRLETIAATIRAEKPKLVIVDSIQTMVHPDLDSGPGSVAQVRESTAVLAALAKTDEVTIFLVGHVNKQGALAGPKVLEHAVDVVLEFDGDRHTSFRLLRSQKNRFGSTHEVGIYEMGVTGLVPVANPSEFFLAERPQGSPGSVVVAAREGSRPILVEIQALVAPAVFGGTPRRQVFGVDYNRVSILLAVLERRAGLALQGHDVYVNVAGGVKLLEPACDLAIALAIASSFLGKGMKAQDVVFGEVGLSGEVRSVSHPGERLSEAARLGFTRAIVPSHKFKGQSQPEREPALHIVPVSTVSAAIKAAFNTAIDTSLG